MKATILFPHQLFKNLDHIDLANPIFLVEEWLFFKQYNFHKQKLVFHRATMKFYEKYLSEKGCEVHYVDGKNELSDIRELIPSLVKAGFNELDIIDPTDNWLKKRILNFSGTVQINIQENSLFINTKSDLESFFKVSKKKYFQTTFYKEQRISRNILMADGQPIGGQWTYDVDNRKKYPRGKVPPRTFLPHNNPFFEEAKNYIEQNFPKNLGELSDQQIYPTTFAEAEDWLKQFFQHRFFDFGIYEDAILKDKNFLNHSVLSPLINIGLLEPLSVIKQAENFAFENNIPLNSLEGFIRQILGWREFIRGVYEAKGSEERTKNFWQHHRKIPDSFYDGTTGIEPIDQTIKKTLKTGYAHHIERLMILGNFMLLCEFDPDEVYQWFMELFIDAYDWVMVPNVYGMSLFADGGIMSTKPYISSSNYIKKMSDYPNGEWQSVWDGLFWRFMNKNRNFLSKNPRLRMLISTLDKMDPVKRENHFKSAEIFLIGLGNTKNEVQLKLI